MSEPQFSREAIYAALFALVNGNALFKTWTRKIREYADVDQSTQPAILLTETTELWDAPPGLPPKVTLRAFFFIYCETADPTVSPSTALNPLLDQLWTALAPILGAGNARQTLGNLVSHARIAGEVKIAEGLSGQSEAVIPIEILVN